MTNPDLAVLLADAPPEVLGRAMLAVAAMHEPDESGRCRWCGPHPRFWRRRRRRCAEPCRTHRVIVAELRTGIGPLWSQG